MSIPGRDATKIPPRLDDWPHCDDCDTAPACRDLGFDRWSRVGGQLRPPNKDGHPAWCVDCARHIHTHESNAYCPQGRLCGDCYHAIVTTGDPSVPPEHRAIRPGGHEKCPDCGTPPWVAPTDLFTAAGVTA